MAEKLGTTTPVDIEKQYAEFQNLQRQGQMVSMQKQQMQLQMEELTIASAELVKATGAVYKSAGPLLIETTKDAAEKEVKEQKEVLEVRVNALGKQEEKIRARLLELKKNIEEMASKMSESGHPTLGKPKGASG